MYRSKDSSITRRNLMLATAGSTLSLTSCGSMRMAYRDKRQKYLDLNAQAMQAVASLPPDQPVEMLNLIQCRDLAEYEAQSAYKENSQTGEQAYKEYVRFLIPIFDKIGASIIYFGDGKFTGIGPAEDDWDIALLVHYPNKGIITKMLSEVHSSGIHVHRTAAVEDSRLYCLQRAT